MAKNQNNKFVWVTVLVAVVSLITGYALSAYLVAPAAISQARSEVAAAYSSSYYYSGYSYTSYETPIPLSAALSASLINHTATVDANGTVATETYKEVYLNITNLATATTSIADDVTLCLEDPQTSQDGLPTALEKTYTRIDYVDISGSTYPLYYNGVYHTKNIGDIGAGSTKVLTLRFTLKVAPAGTYVDGQTYNWYLWYSQPLAGDYAPQVSGTLTT